MPSLRSIAPVVGVLLLLPSLLACQTDKEKVDADKAAEAYRYKHQFSPYEISPITATFAKPVTTYMVSVTSVDPGYRSPEAAAYVWTTSALCGTFVGSGNTATWSHPDKESGGDCPTEPIHPGIIRVDVRVSPWHCFAMYTNGSAAGPGPETPPCN